MAARNTSKLVDEVIRAMATAGAVGSVLVAPNMLIALDKPLRTLYKALDERERQRKLQDTMYYMKSRGYLTGDYDHGLQLADKARKRLEKAELADLAMRSGPVWDHFWRIVLYDIPESSKARRNRFHAHLRVVGCFQLQRSVWITPFPCRDIVEAIAAQNKVDAYVTYFEARNLDNERVMLEHFRKKYPEIKF